MTTLEKVGAFAAIVAAVTGIWAIVNWYVSRRARINVRGPGTYPYDEGVGLTATFANEGETTVHFAVAAFVDGREIARNPNPQSLRPQDPAVSLGVNVALGEGRELVGERVEVAAVGRRRTIARVRVEEIKLREARVVLKPRATTRPRAA